MSDTTQKAIDSREKDKAKLADKVEKAAKKANASQKAIDSREKDKATIITITNYEA